MRSFLSILLAVLMTLSASGDLSDLAVLPDSRAEASDPLQPAGEDAPDRTADAEPENAPARSADAPAIPDMAEVEYRRYDPAGFYARTDRLTELAAGDDSQAVIELYDALYDEYAHIDTLRALAYIRSCGDVTDQYWSEQSVYCDTLAAETADALCVACYAVTQGPCADAFAAHVGPEVAEVFAGYQPLTDRDAALLTRQSELVDQYYALMDTSDELTCSYLGQTWDWSMITGFQGSSLALQDYDGYLEVYYALQKALNDQVGPLFTQLVQLRAELAESQGYASYADLAYADAYGRDYTPEDAQLFCDAVKAVSRDYYESLYYSDLWYRSDAPMPALDAEGLLETLGEYAARLDGDLAQPWQVMTDQHLYDIAVGDSRAPLNFTLTLSEYETPFLFVSLYGDCYDLSSVAHEFGHFASEYATACPNILAYVGSYDLMEIHSNTLDALLTGYYDEIYDTGADVARFTVLGGLIESVLEGCIYDEFQRAVYAQPDMTLDEMNRLFADICSQYGMEETTDVDYSWMYVSHNFDEPLYYMSYAVSSLAAIQIWDLAQEDLQAGVDMWKRIQAHDFYTEGYTDVLRGCGLRLFTEEGAVADIFQPLLAELSRLDAEA